MKLRIRGDSLRLRLTRGEVDALAKEGWVEETIHFGEAPAQTLTYAVQLDGATDSINAVYQGPQIVVRLPRTLGLQWATSNEVGLETEQAVGASRLRILVEKDFQCLVTRKGEDDGDAYTNPQAGTKC